MFGGEAVDEVQGIVEGAGRLVDARAEEGGW